MVLTRYQLANLETGTESYRNKRKSTDHEDVLVADPPIVTISRSHQTQQDNSLDAPLKVDALLEQLDDYECSTLDALMMRWPSLHSRLKGMKPHLPPKKADNKPTLVLDLDETLLHTYRDMDNKYDVDYVLYDHHRTSRLLAGRLRPGVMDFLTWASDAFEIVVWTAGTRDYAMMARTCLDPNNQLITHILSRNSCIQVRSASALQVVYVKDLCALGRDLSKTFLVDNTPHAASLNLSNWIPIQAYVGGSSDTQLTELRQYLESHVVCFTDKRNDLRLVLHRQLDLKRRIRERVEHWRQTQSL